MSMFDWDTNTVTLHNGTIIEIDMDNPLHVILAEAARGYDDATDQVKDAARGLARAAQQIADRADESVHPMAGLGYEQMAADIGKAQAKREAYSKSVSVAAHMIQKSA